MWVRTTQGTLVNIDQMESIYVKGCCVVCAGHKYQRDIPNERILATLPTKEDAEIVLRIVSGALHVNDENLIYMPSLESLENIKEEAGLDNA